jgi:hypothetical protein
LHSGALATAASAGDVVQMSDVVYSEAYDYAYGANLRAAVQAGKLQQALHDDARKDAHLYALAAVASVSSLIPEASLPPSNNSSMIAIQGHLYKAREAPVGPATLVKPATPYMSARTSPRHVPASDAAVDDFVIDASPAGDESAAPSTTVDLATAFLNSVQGKGSARVTTTALPRGRQVGKQASGMWLIASCLQIVRFIVSVRFCVVVSGVLVSPNRSRSPPSAPPFSVSHTASS